MKATTKAATKKLVLAEIDRLWRDADNNIKTMQGEKSNPIVHDMLVKNAGFKLALEDINQFIGNLRG